MVKPLASCIDDDMPYNHHTDKTLQLNSHFETAADQWSGFLQPAAEDAQMGFDAGWLEKQGY